MNLKKNGVGILAIIVFLMILTIPARADRISFGYQNGVNYVSAMVADELGFFEEEGLDVEGKIFTSGPLVTESLVSGSIQVGMMGDTPAIIAVTKELPVTILASVAGGPERNRLMVRPEGGINNLSDLEGKRIGIPYGTSSHGGLYTLARQKNIDLDNLTLLNIRPADMVDALGTAQVDAVVVWEPTPSLIEAEGSGIELMTLKKINNQFPTFLMANKLLLDSNPEVGTKIINALDKANQFINNNWEEAVDIAARVTGLDKDVVDNAMDYIYYDLNLNQKTIDSFNQTAHFLLEYQSISNLPEVDKSFDKTHLDQATIE